MDLIFLIPSWDLSANASYVLYHTIWKCFLRIWSVRYESSRAVDLFIWLPCSICNWRKLLDVSMAGKPRYNWILKHQNVGEEYNSDWIIWQELDKRFFFGKHTFSLSSLVDSLHLFCFWQHESYLCALFPFLDIMKKFVLRYGGLYRLLQWRFKGDIGVWTCCVILCIGYLSRYKYLLRN